jgi:hypothetical protein
MKIAVIRETGPLGSRSAELSKWRSRDVLVAAPDTGADTITDEELEAAFRDAEVVTNFASSRSFEEVAAMQFLRASGLIPATGGAPATPRAQLGGARI